MKIHASKEADKLLIRPEGRLDTMTSPELEAVIREQIDGLTHLEFDFSDLVYISSAGLRVLLQAQKIMNRQGDMVLRHVNAEVMEVFSITGFDDILTIE